MKFLNLSDCSQLFGLVKVIRNGDFLKLECHFDETRFPRLGQEIKLNSIVLLVPFVELMSETENRSVTSLGLSCSFPDANGTADGGRGVSSILIPIIDSWSEKQETILEALGLDN